MTGLSGGGNRSSWRKPLTNRVRLVLQVVQEYQERKTRIARLEQEVEEKRSTLEHQQGETERIKAEWLEPLKSLMARINQNFSYFFRCMRCAGEVDLFVPENEVGSAGLDANLKRYPQEQQDPRIYWSCKIFTGPTNFFSYLYQPWGGKLVNKNVPE